MYVTKVIYDIAYFTQAVLHMELIVHVHTHKNIFLRCYLWTGNFKKYNITSLDHIKFSENYMRFQKHKNMLMIKRYKIYYHFMFRVTQLISDTSWAMFENS